MLFRQSKNWENFINIMEISHGFEASKNTDKLDIFTKNRAMV